jgi:hypothetical protein
MATKVHLLLYQLLIGMARGKPFFQGAQPMLPAAASLPGMQPSRQRAATIPQAQEGQRPLREDEKPLYRAVRDWFNDLADDAQVSGLDWDKERFAQQMSDLLAEQLTTIGQGVVPVLVTGDRILSQLSEDDQQPWIDLMNEAVTAVVEEYAPEQAALLADSTDRWVSERQFDKAFGPARTKVITITEANAVKNALPVVLIAVYNQVIQG